MESPGEAGTIQFAPVTRELLEEQFDLDERGLIDVRGKGRLRIWFLIRRKPAPRKPALGKPALGKPGLAPAPHPPSDHA